MEEVVRPRARQDALVIQEFDSDLLIYLLCVNKTFCLNETSARVWQACDGNNSIAEIGKKIGDDDIVWLALNQLEKERLIEPRSAPGGRFDGMSRREVIKSIGLGSMIALPIISSMVAPTAAHAQTLLANGVVAGTIDVPVGTPGGCPGAIGRNLACDNMFASLCASGNTDASVCVPPTLPSVITCTPAP